MTESADKSPPAPSMPAPAKMAVSDVAVPSIKSVHALLLSLKGQLKGARNDLDNQTELLEAVLLKLEENSRLTKPPPDVFRVSPLPSPTSLLVPGPVATAPRPSLAVQAGKTTAKVAPWVLVLLGVLSEVAARHTAQGGAFSAILKMIFPGSP